MILGKTVLVALAAAGMITGCSSRQDLQNNYETAQQAAKQGDFKAAAADMTPIVQADSNDPSAYLAQAYAYVNAGEDDQAIQDVSRVIHFLSRRRHRISGYARNYTRASAASISPSTTRIRWSILRRIPRISIQPRLHLHDAREQRSGAGGFLQGDQT